MNFIFFCQERGRYDKYKRVMALIDHIELGYPYRLYEFLKACQLTGHNEIIDLFGVDSSFYSGPLQKLLAEPRW